MDAAEQARFEEANRIVHRVEDEWHYPILTRHGYVPQQSSQVGFVRFYDYTGPDGHTIVAGTGYHQDYWNTPDIRWPEGMRTVKDMLWSELEAYLESREESA